MKKKLLFWLVLFVLTVFVHSMAQFGFRYTSTEVRDLIRKSKLNLYLIPIMEEYDIDCWIILTRDPCSDMTNVIYERNIQLDPIVEYIGGEAVTVPAAFIFTTSGERIVIAAARDAKAIAATGIYKRILPYTYNRKKGHTEFLEILGKTVKELNPTKIGLNFSEEEGVADGLTVGMKLIFDKAVGPQYASRVASAEKIIISIWGRKTPAEIHLIEKSSRLSAEITEEALRMIVPGKTTARDIFDNIRRRVKEEGMELGWHSWRCPVVTVGTFRLGRPPSDKIIERGELVVINSGFCVEGHMSDINKIAYVLDEGETEPPELIKEIFETGLKATRAAVAKIKPGATGYEVDRAARDVVLNAGFNEYGHGSGHTTGLWVHGLGVLLNPPWKAYGSKVYMKIHKNDIYAVEPSISVYSEKHKGIIRIHFQEMVIVEEEGARYLTPPVTELMLIK
jgi:Xaa-Pro aminopeptidase